MGVSVPLLSSIEVIFHTESHYASISDIIMDLYQSLSGVMLTADNLHRTPDDALLSYTNNQSLGSSANLASTRPLVYQRRPGNSAQYGRGSVRGPILLDPFYMIA